MTIASANLLPQIFTSTDGSQNGLTVDTIPSQAGKLASAELSPDEVEFLALINRELGELDGMQALENNDLLALINELEGQLDDSEGSVALTSEWLQILKSHFGASSEAEDASVSRVISGGLITDKPQEGLHSRQNSETTDVSTIADSETDSLLKQASGHTDGEALPLTWQDQAALQQKNSTAAENGIRVKQAVNESPAGPVNSSHTDPRARVETVQKGNFEQFGIGEPTDKSSGASVTLKEGESSRNELSKDKPFIIPSSREHFNSLLKSAEPAGTVQNAVTSGIQALNPSPMSSSQLLAPSTQTLTLPPQAQSAEWGQAIGERVALLINGNMNRAEIRIDPPHLGKLDIQIQLKDDSAVVMIQTQHVQTRDLIESASARLREFLQDAGYSSVDVNVSHREHAESGEGYGQQSAFADADTSANGLADADSSPLHAAEVAISEQAGVIDYFA